MQEVIVMLNEEPVKINALRVFHWRNPKTNRHGVSLMEADTEKWVRLFCQDEEEAETLTQKINEGKIADLTTYLAEWNMFIIDS